jgi:DNA-binding NtrC family response regulator
LAAKEQAMKNKPGHPVPGSANDNSRLTNLSALERARIEHTLEELQWNIEEAAVSLGYSVETLRQKIRDYGLDLN